VEYLLHILLITGIYIILTLATFGFGVIVYPVAKNWVSLTKGPLSGGSKKKGLSGNNNHFCHK